LVPFDKHIIGGGGFNEELYQLYGEPEIVKWIRPARLRWAGHIIRMRESDPSRKLTFDLLLGIPKRGWIVEVETEMKGVVVKGWKKISVGKG
jgi:hypothetical protein